MVASLWHCPRPDSFDEHGCYAGAATIGSTEACLLAGLAMKFRWRKWYANKMGLNEAQVSGGDGEATGMRRLTEGRRELERP